MLRLEVLDYAGPTSWRWRLTTPEGVFVADHVVALDSAAWQHRAFLDLQAYLRSYTAPDRREEQEADLLAQVGDWVSACVLGPIAVALAAHRGSVRIELPWQAAVLGYLPWELARVEGRTLASGKVTFVVDHQPRSTVPKGPVGARLRMLAVFSLPEGAGALNLRKERFALARLVHTIASVNNKAIELRVLQYGATRARLSDALLEAEGWDVVHISGHGLPAGVVLETSSGERDHISSVDLVSLLDLSAAQIKLVTLSACSSAAVTAEEHLSLLGFSLPTRAAEPSGGSLPAVATEVVRQLDCAVVAMRFEVIDDFAIALAGEFYDLVLGKGQPVARALSLALSRVAAITPLSPVTPTLFGASAGSLTLVPPAGEPLVFQPELAKLAEFPPQPDRFVGRVGPMTRATTALAPHSGRSGVLFHGMAGGGKTACAVELAYTHQDSFPLIAWYAAVGDHAVSLTEFALALERQLPGLKFVHTVNNIEEFRRFLPGLTEVLEQHRVLIVLDNAETLLTDDGQWRDERWSLLITAMTAHKGLSRLVVTSRIRPRLADSVVVEAVHALSLRETVLLAREWPQLRALLDDDHSLAAGVLTTVQGHPKLIELANGLASDRTALAERVSGAQYAWMARGTRLEPFLRGDDSVASDADYLTVLTVWTQATARSLPDQAREVFLKLCCVEERDRNVVFFHDVDHELALLAERGLIEVTSHFLRLHPGVAEAGLALAGPAFARSVDEEFAALWLESLAWAREREHLDGTTAKVSDVAVSALPYLHRLGRWDELALAADMAFMQNMTPRMVALTLPFLDAAVAGGVGLTGQGVHAKAVALVDRERGERVLRDLLARGVAEAEFAMASAAATDLVKLLHGEGRLDEALELARHKREYTRQAGHGPWSQAFDEHVVLRILFDQGEARTALDGVRRLLAALPESSDQPEHTSGWVVREQLLNLASITAMTLGDHDAAAGYAEELFRSGESRGTTPKEQVVARFNQASLLGQAGRIDEARELLVWCRGVCEQLGDVELLGSVIGSQGWLEYLLGHHARAAELQVDALRFAYLAREVAAIGTGHHDLAVLYGELDHTSPHAWAHYFASALISFRTGHRLLDNVIEKLALHAFAGGPPEHRSFDDVCALVEEVDGVRLRDLLATLPERHANEVLHLTNRAFTRANELTQEWTPVMAAVTHSANGHHEYDEQLRAALVNLGPDAAGLVRALERIMAGERGPELFEGLPMLGIGIVASVLRALR